MYSTFASMLRSTAMHAMLPVYAGVYLGFSSSQVGFLFGITGLVTLLAMGPAGFLSDTLGRKWAVVPAAALAGISFIAFAPLHLASALLLGLVARETLQRRRSDASRA